VKRKEKIGIFREADIGRIARDIIESYHYETDFLSELLQNAVDSIRQTGRKSGNKISIEYIAHRGLYIVTDNGIGMSKDDLKLFAIGRTDKGTLSTLLIGEKGVGGSYVLCQSDFLEIESVKNGKKVRAVCEKARETIYNGDEPELEIIEDAEVSGIDNYTKILTRSVDFKPYSELKEFGEDLRMFTAVGNTRVPFEKEDIDIQIQVSLTTKDEAGKEYRTSEVIPFCFLYSPREYGDRVITYDELEKIKPTPPDSCYNNYLFSIVDKDNGILGIFGSERILHELNIPSSIVLGVKGAPFPVEIVPPKTGSFPYWRNLFILINRDDITLDVGRKSINQKDLREIKSQLRDFFNRKVVKYAKLFSEKKTALPGALDQLKEQAMAKKDLDIPKIAFEKAPSRGEEAAVIGIFHELIGAGLLKGYHTLSESHDSQYDGIIRYSIPISKLGESAKESVKKSFRNVRDKPSHYTQTGFIEFKVDAADFMSDCDRGKKNIEDVMILVSFDLNRKRMKKGWRVDPIPNSARVFSGAKFKLVHESLDRDVPIILLKEFKYIE